MYIDTSVLVKRYTPEPDSDEVDDLMVNNNLVTSELAVGELWSALLAKERAAIITAQERGFAWSAFTEDIDEGVIRLVPIDGVTVREANEMMIRVHPDVPLRTLDAIHLATFDSVNTGPLFTKDRRMLAAAKALEFAVV